MNLPFLKRRVSVSAQLGALGFMPEVFSDVPAFNQLNFYSGHVDVVFPRMSEHLGVRSRWFDASLQLRNLEQPWLRLHMSPEELNNALAVLQA